MRPYEERCRVRPPGGTSNRGAADTGPQRKPSEAASFGRGRAAKGTSLAPPGKASDLELARTRLVVLRRGGETSPKRRSRIYTGGPVWDRPLRRGIKPGRRADNIRPYGITSARHPAGAQCAPLRTAGQGLSTSLYYKASVRSFTYYSILSEKEIKSESCKRIIRIGYEVVRAD